MNYGWRNYDDEVVRVDLKHKVSVCIRDRSDLSEKLRRTTPSGDTHNNYRIRSLYKENIGVEATGPDCFGGEVSYPYFEHFCMGNLALGVTHILKT